MVAATVVVVVVSRPAKNPGTGSVHLHHSLSLSLSLKVPGEGESHINHRVQKLSQACFSLSVVWFCGGRFAVLTLSVFRRKQISVQVLSWFLLLVHCTLHTRFYLG